MTCMTEVFMLPLLIIIIKQFSTFEFAGEENLIKLIKQSQQIVQHSLLCELAMVAVNWP